MLNDLLLLSGNDIPFEEAAVTMHPPKIREIVEKILFIQVAES